MTGLQNLAHCMPMQRAIGIGIVGAGWMGRAHAAAYSRFRETWPEHELVPQVVHVSDIDEVAAETLADRCSASRWGADWQRLVDDPAVEIVHVTVPHDMHAPVMIAAAESGRHVSCEKPMGLNVEEASAIVATVRRKGVISQVGYHHRLLPAIRHARELVDEGSIGEVRHLVGEFITDPGWKPSAPFSWRYDKERAGWGALSDLGSHVVDLITFLCGPITRVVAITKTYIERRPAASVDRLVTNDDLFALIAELQTGAIGILYGSRVATGGRAALRIALDGSLAAFDWNLERINEFGISTPGDDGDYGRTRVLCGPEHPGYRDLSPVAGLGLGWHDGKLLEARELLDAIAEGRKSRLDTSIGLDVMQVLEAADLSAQTGLWTDVSTDRASYRSGP